MTAADQASTWVEIDSSAIVSNVRALANHVGVRVMAVVKANGYGHGAAAAARAALRGGASWIGVARPEEGLDLREAGIDAPILVFGLTPPGQLAEALQAGLSLTVWSREQIEAASAAASNTGQPAHLHLKVDTGMGRIGAAAEDAPALARLAASRTDIAWEAVYTHFARADEPDPEPTRTQERVFRDVLEALEASGVRPSLTHAANSAAAIAHPSTRFDLVRAGLAIYGLHPSPSCRLPAGFRPALAWKSQISQLKSVPAGRGLSYGHAYVTRQEERIATVPVGYGDGFRRTEGNEVLIGGRRAPVVGRVCMDQLLVRLDGPDSARPGDEVILIGSQGEERISAEDVARRWGTINYEVTCAIAARVPRRMS